MGFRKNSYLLPLEKPYNDPPTITNTLLQAKYANKKSNADYDVKSQKTPPLKRTNIPSDGTLSKEQISLCRIEAVASSASIKIETELEVEKDSTTK